MRDFCHKTAKGAVRLARICVNRFQNSENGFFNGLASRKEFASLVTAEMRALEIGPFASPLLHGKNVSYCDVLDQTNLRKRAAGLGLNPDAVPFVRYVLGVGGLDEVGDVFDAVLSSHAIEHQPDLINHLQQVQRRLENGSGRYFVLIPDKRYCFDKYIATSTIAEVIQAHTEQRTTHCLRSVIEHRSLTTHNNSLVHWLRPGALRPAVSANSVSAAVNEWRQAEGKYIDVHAWYFTPDSFIELVDLLVRLGYIKLKVDKLYTTTFGSNEFWVIFKMPPLEF